MTTPRPTKSEIFTAYNHLRVFARKHPELVDPARVNKALGILLSNDYYQGKRAEYRPTMRACDCKDWEFRFAKRRKYTGACKHMLAEIMLSKITERRALHDIAGWIEKHESAYVLESDYRL